MSNKNASAVVKGLITLALLGIIGMFLLPTADWWWLGTAVVVGALLICLVLADDRTPARAPPDPAFRASAKSKGPIKVERAAAAPATGAPRKMAVRVPLEGFGPGVWIPKDQVVTVGGVTLSSGMFYFGTSLKAHNGSVDPALIDPSKDVAARGDYTARDLGAWPSYTNISSRARRAYLNWLADGRSDPAADIGYVYLYFFGLERRALIDPLTVPESRNDWPAIVAEVWRLLGIYGAKSTRFRASANRLLSWLLLCDRPSNTHKNAVPPFMRTFELPFYIHYALGDAVINRAPISDQLALAWARLDPDIVLPASAQRCPEAFDQLFMSKFSAKHGFGMTVSSNRTKLKFVYRAASPGFHGLDELRLSFGEMPDVTVQTEPRLRVAEIVNEVGKELDAYSRTLGDDAQSHDPLDSLLHLPLNLWPESARVLPEQIGSDYVLVPFSDLLTRLAVDTPFGSERSPALARLLAFMHLDLAPALHQDAEVPGPNDPVVLYAVPANERRLSPTPDFEVALLSLRLAVGASAALGDFSDANVDHLSGRIHAWTHLETNHQRRLMAHLRLLIENPALPTLASDLIPADPASRDFLAAVIASLLQVGSAPTAEEAKVLDKIYEILSIDDKPNAVRVAGLRRDGGKVSALLATLFPEQPVAASPAPVVRAPAASANDQTIGSTGLLGLGPEYVTVARVLLTRGPCRRSELLDVVTDLDIRLISALDRLNAASQSQYGVEFAQGEDPIDVDPAVRQKIEV